MLKLLFKCMYVQTCIIIIFNWKLKILILQFCKWIICPLLEETRLRVLSSLSLLSDSSLQDAPLIFNVRQTWIAEKSTDFPENHFAFMAENASVRFLC